MHLYGQSFRLSLGNQQQQQQEQQAANSNGSRLAAAEADLVVQQTLMT